MRGRDTVPLVILSERDIWIPVKLNKGIYCGLGNINQDIFLILHKRGRPCKCIYMHCSYTVWV